MYMRKFVKSVIKKLTKSRVSIDPSTTIVSAEPKVYQLPHNNQFLEVIQTQRNSNYIGSNWLIKYMANNFSEHGEDGIIEKIFEILKPENKWVCEFGAHDPEQISNTWRLINKEGW